MRDSERAPADRAYQKALEMLGRRDHSRGELQRKLAARGFAEADLTIALDRLAAHGFIDDRKFAARWVETALGNGRGYGPRLLADLRSRGIDRETAELALAAAAVEHPASQVLAAVIARRFAGFDNRTATPRDKQRVYAYLQRRGFPLTAIFAYFNNNDTESG